MRILHVNKFLYRRGGAESYLFDLAELQRGAGHDVACFGMDHPDNDPQEFAGFFPPHVELEPVPPGARAKAAAVARMVWSPQSRRGLAHVIDAFRPDVVHLHNIYHQLSPSVLAACRAAGVPAVMTLHDYKLACPSYQLLDHGRLCDACLTGGPLQAVRRRCKDDSLGASTVLAVESWLHRVMNAYDGVDAFVCPSRFLAATMTTADVYPDRMHVVRHFVDLAGTPAREGAGDGFVFAGRLSHEKGADTLVSALRHAPVSTRLEVAGEGPTQAALEEQARRQAPGQVQFHGRLAKPELMSLLRGSRAVVVPSRWHENQPMIVLEALGSGVPVITTSLGGLPELVDDGVDGIVVPADQPATLGAALQRLADDPDLAERMGSAGRRKVADHFSPQRHLRDIESVYAAAAARRAAAPGRTRARRAATV